MTQLRTSWGLNLREIEEKSNTSIKEEILKEASQFLLNGTLIQKDETLYLSKEGKLLADYIAAELFLDEMAKSKF